MTAFRGAAVLLVLLPMAVVAGSMGATASRRAQSEYLRGTLLEKRGAYAEALAAYEKALELDPSSAFIAGEAAGLALELDDRARAEKWARRRLELAPNDAQSRVILGRVLWAAGDTAGAEAQFEQALKDDPSSADALFEMIELIAGRVPARARELLEKFLKANPDHAARVLYELGRLDAQEERYDAAVDKLRRAIALDDAQSGPARMALAQVYELRRDTAAAVAEYRRLLADEPDDMELWAHVGELQAVGGDLEEARATFRRMKERKPDEPAACAWLAEDAQHEGDFKRAAAYLRDSAELKDDPALNLRLGYYELQSGSVKDAMAVLGAARRRWPKDDRIAYYLALGYDDLGRHRRAAKLLREVLASKPDDRLARWQLATILEKLDRMSEAEEEFRRLIAEKPDDAPALNYLGYALAERGRKLPEAETMIRKALAIEPSNPAYRDSLGWVLFKRGHSTEAAQELTAVARVLPDDESVWDHLGDVHQAQGLREEAWRAWRRAQVLGATRAGGKADALQKTLGREESGELWRAHLASVHGGVRRFSALCQASGSVKGAAFSQKVLLTFRAPRELTLEILGPLFSPVARARVDAGGFTMDSFPIDGVEDGQERSAVQGAMSTIVAMFAGEPFAPGEARFETGWWGRRELARKDWRIALSRAAVAQSVASSAGAAMELTDYYQEGARRIPKAFEAKGLLWNFALVCAEPKMEIAREEPSLKAR